MTTSAEAGNANTQTDDTRGDELSVLVDGERWTGWQELEVVRAIDAAAGRFRVKVAPILGSTWPLRPGVDVKVALGTDRRGEDVPLLRGRVDSVRATLEKGGRAVEVQGRDLAASLVDSSVSLPVYEWRYAKLREIVEDILQPFGLKIGPAPTLDVVATFERFEVFQCSATDRAWSVIERACRQKGLLVWSQPDGRLRIGRPGGNPSTTDLVEGENVIRARFRWDHSGRHSVYRVEGQTSGSDAGWGDELLSLDGEARDLEIAQFRPLTIRGEQGMSAEDCVRRAEWEATVRRARSSALEIQVPGWRQALDAENPRPLWDVDQDVYVSLPSLGLEGTFLVSRVRFRRTVKGPRTTDLELVPPDAFQPKPTQEQPEAFDEFLVDGGS